MKKLFSIVALLGVLSAFAVGCGGDAKTKPATTSPAASPSPAKSPSPA